MFLVTNENMGLCLYMSNPPPFSIKGDSLYFIIIIVMLVIAGLLFKFTIIKMRGPNKPLNHIWTELKNDRRGRGINFWVKFKWHNFWMVPKLCHIFKPTFSFWKKCHIFDRFKLAQIVQSSLHRLLYILSRLLIITLLKILLYLSIWMKALFWGFFRT